MNFKKGFRRIAKVLSVVCTLYWLLFATNSYWYGDKFYLRLTDFSGWVLWEFLLYLVIGALITPLTYYAYIALEKLFLWIKDGFTKD